MTMLTHKHISYQQLTGDNQFFSESDNRSPSNIFQWNINKYPSIAFSLVRRYWCPSSYFPSPRGRTCKFSYLHHSIVANIMYVLKHGAKILLENIINDMAPTTLSSSDDPHPTASTLITETSGEATAIHPTSMASSPSTLDMSLTIPSTSAYDFSTLINPPATINPLASDMDPLATIFPSLPAALLQPPPPAVETNVSPITLDPRIAGGLGVGFVIVAGLVMFVIRCWLRQRRLTHASSTASSGKGGEGEFHAFIKGRASAGVDVDGRTRDDDRSSGSTHV